MNQSLDTWPDDRAIELSECVLSAPSSVHMAIMIALYLGCSPIYLLGFDHDWLAHRGMETHFYPAAIDERTTGDLSLIPYREMMELTLLVWNYHQKLNAVANACGCNIYNATAGGFLDVYPRVQFETLIELKTSAARGRANSF